MVGVDRVEAPDPGESLQDLLVGGAAGQPEALAHHPQGVGGRGRAGQGVELLEELGERRPRGRVVERAEGGGDEVGVGEGHRAALAVGQLGGLGEQPLGQPVVAPLGVAGGEGAVGAAEVAEPEERLEGVVGALLAAQPGVGGERPGLVAPAGGVGDRVDHAVDHHRPDLAREHVGVGGADGGPVGVADEGHLAVADRLAEQVHVAGHVGGRHVVEDRPAALGAGPGARPGRPGSRRAPPGGSPGTGTAARAARASSVVSKHCSGVLRATPRGSKPTRSNLARTSASTAPGPAPGRSRPRSRRGRRG